MNFLANPTHLFNKRAFRPWEGGGGEVGEGWWVWKDLNLVGSRGQ